MDESSAWIGIAAVIASFVGPLAGVAIANRFTRQEARRTKASELFRQIMEDIQNYRHAFVDQYRFEAQLQRAAQTVEALKRRKVGAIAGKSGPAMHEYEEAGILLDYSMEDAHRTQERFDAAFRAVRSMESRLNADVLSLGLLFDKQSEKCGRSIRDLIAMSEVLKQQTPPQLSLCEERLNVLIQQIAQEMKPLHESLRETEPLAA